MQTVEEKLESRTKLVRIAIDRLRKLRKEMRKEGFQQYPLAIRIAVFAHEAECKESLAQRIELLRNTRSEQLQ